MEVNKIAMYYPDTREIIFRPYIAGFPVVFKRRFVSHEMATDMVDQIKVIPADSYIPRDREIVEQILTDPILREAGFTIGQTYIEWLGFRKVLMSEGFALGDLFPSAKIFDLDEIYPTIFEIITDQLYLRNDNIARLDTDIQKGKVMIPQHEDHPNVATVLFAAAKRMDWQQMLRAFKTKDVDQLYYSFARRFNRNTDQLILTFLEAMVVDERIIHMTNLQVLSEAKNSRP